MSVVEVTEVGVVCCNEICGKTRGKSAQPWRKCLDCGGVLCRRCAPDGCQAGREPRCYPCNKKKWEAERALEKATPIECKGCKKSVLPDDAEQHYFCGSHSIKLCKACMTTLHNVRAFEESETRKIKAKPGLVEVVYGVHIPKEDGGRGYAYHKGNLDVGLGDIVMLPPTWKDTEIDGNYAEHEGTVVSTYSDYDKGPVSSIRSLVKKAKDR